MATEPCIGGGQGDDSCGYPRAWENRVNGTDPALGPSCSWVGHAVTKSSAPLEQTKGLAISQARAALRTWSSHEPAGVPEHGREACKLGRGAHTSSQAVAWTPGRGVGNISSPH